VFAQRHADSLLVRCHGPLMEAAETPAFASDAAWFT